MNPQKILLFRPSLGQGGADRVTLNLLHALERRAFAPSLVLLRAEGEFLADVPPDVPVYTLAARSLKTAVGPLARLLRAQRPDVLFSTSSGGNVIAVLAHRLARAGGRVVLSERNVLLHGTPTLQKRGVTWLKRWVYPRADNITSVSQSVKDDLVARLGLSPERVQVVHNPIVTPELATLAAAPVAHSWFHEDTPVILGVGRLVGEKDFPTLINAFARIRAERPARLFILGDGPAQPALRALTQRLGLQEDVWFAPFDKNPFKYMARCSVFALSSRYEGLSGVLIQAMAVGAAVVTTDCPGAGEIVTDKVDGLLTPMGDAPALAVRISYLLDNPAVARRLKAQAQVSAQRFNVANVTQKYAQALST